MTNSADTGLKEWLVTGKLLKSRGLAGEIGIYPYSDDPERFLHIRRCRLQNEDESSTREVNIQQVKIAGNKVFLRFMGVDSREKADELTGLYLAVPRSEAIPLDEFSWYMTDLVGCRVEDRDRGDLGVLKEVIENSANDLLVVAKDGEKDLIIPFLKAILDQVDIQARIIKLSLPDGLYELYRGE